MDTMTGFACKHVCAGAPVKRAVHDVPVDETDSGWALSCGLDSHAGEEYLLTDLDRLLRQDGSLAAVLGLRLYTVVYRGHRYHPWRVEALGVPPEMQN